jgi:transposase
MIAAAKTIHKHLDEILIRFNSKVSNGILEAANGLIQLAKRQDRKILEP